MQKNRPEIRFEGFDDGWEQRKLGDIFKYEQPQAYIVESTEYDDKNDIPVLTAGQSFILGYTDERFGIKEANEENPVIIFDDFTTSSHYVDFPFKIKSSAMKLLTLNNPKDDIHCTFNVLQNIGYVPVSHERHWISTFAKFNVLLPKSSSEQKQIGSYFRNLDNLITLHQRKCDRLQALKKAMLEKMFPKAGSDVPEIRFAGFTDGWEQRKFSELYAKSSEKNDGSIGMDRNITVATMQFKDDVKVSTAEYLKTYYTFNLGDIAFEGHQSKEFRFGRFVENDIGNGIVSHIFTVFRPIIEFDLQFWKYAINNEMLMQQILSRSTKASTMMHDLVTDDFLNETFLVPSLDEQKQIGACLYSLDNLITLHQRKLQKLQECKKALLEKMFVG